MPKRLKPHGYSWERRRLKKRLLAEDPHCFYCRAPLDRDTATFDHVKPISKGGTFRESNIVLACQPCNIKKGDQDIQAFSYGHKGG